MNYLDYTYGNIFDIFPIDCLKKENPQKEEAPSASQLKNSSQPVSTSLNLETAQNINEICNSCSAVKIADLWHNSQNDLCHNCIRKNARALKKKKFFGYTCIRCLSIKSHHWYQQKGSEYNLCYKCHHATLGKICTFCSTTNSDHWYKTKDAGKNMCRWCYCVDHKKRKLF